MFLTLLFVRGITALTGCGQMCTCVEEKLCSHAEAGMALTHGHMHAHPCSGPSASSKVGLLNDPRVGRLACFDNAAVKKKKKKRKHGEEKTAGIRDRNKRFAHRQHAVSSIWCCIYAEEARAWCDVGRDYIWRGMLQDSHLQLFKHTTLSLNTVGKRPRQRT